MFVQVGERGSFTLGAAAAGVPQPVVSRRIAALERHLGGLLFDREGRRAALTPFGRDLLPSARRLVELTRTPVERFEPAEVHLAQSLAIAARTAGRGHPVPQLDVGRTNSGTARACVDLLHALWVPTRVPAAAAARVRSLMGLNVIRHRLAPDFGSDASRWSSKTGTLLNLRHEIGVVEHDDGSRYAVAALTESTVPAAVQPTAEAVLARVARTLHDLLRAG